MKPGAAGRVLRWALRLCVVAWLLAGCRAEPRNAVPLIVASARTPDQVLVGEMTRQLLEARGYRVEDRIGYGESWAVRTALESYAVDICWEYTGDTWLLHLKHDQPLRDAARVWEEIRREDAYNGIVWVAQADAHRTLGLLMRADTARQLELASISELAHYVRRRNAQTSLCAPESLYESMRGVRGLERAYGFAFNPERVSLISFAQGYAALSEGACDCALGTSLEAQAGTEGLLLLSDDQGFFQSSRLAVAVRAPVLEQFPELESILTDLAGLLNQEDLTRLYRQMVIEEQSAAKVARRFLAAHDMLGSEAPGSQDATE
jgi:osmoprotectant transport system substrate-binding protein